MRIYEENEEECAVKIIGDYLKEEKNIQIKNDIHLTEEKEEQPPDYYFEIGDDKIGCEVRHFSLGKKGINLQKESSDKRTIEKRAERCLQEQGIPVLAVSFDFALPSTEVHKNVEKIVDIITIMHNESITDSNEYQRNNRERYYDLFIENNFDYIRYQLTGQKGFCQSYGSGSVITRPIKIEEMQAVITKKNKKIPNWKKIPNSEECYDPKWLIIANYGNFDFFILKEAAEEVEYKCNFDKVFYFEWMGIEPKPQQRRIGSVTDQYVVYELKVTSGQGEY